MLLLPEQKIRFLRVRRADGQDDQQVVLHDLRFTQGAVCFRIIVPGAAQALPAVFFKSFGNGFRGCDILCAEHDEFTAAGGVLPGQISIIRIILRINSDNVRQFFFIQRDQLFMVL